MRIQYKDKFDKQRRNFIKTVTAAGISPSLMRSCGMVGAMMMGRSAEAAGAPNKSLAIYVAGGAVSELWLPSSNLAMKPMSKGFETHGVKNDIHYLTNGTLTGAGHGQMFHRFAGGYSETSFDVMMGKTISADFPLQFLNVGAESSSGESPTRENNRGIATIDDPRAAFSRLTSALGSSGGTTSPGSTSDTLNPKRFYVDRHKEAIQALFGKLGQHEREKLESHLAAIEQIEATVGTTTSPPANQAPVQACGNLSMPSSSGSGFDSTAKLQIDIAVLALSCNLTASASIAFGDDNNKFYVPGYNGPLHDSHHCCELDRTNYTITAAYMFGLAALTVKKAKEAGLLESTIITQVSDMGDGKDHLNSNVPMFIAGGGGAVQTGKISDMGGKNQTAMYETVARILGADQHPAYKTLSSSTVSGVAG